MEQYIFIRDFRSVKRKSLLIAEGNGYRVVKPSGVKMSPKIKEISDHLSIHLLPLNKDLYKTAFHSFAYSNWIKEKIADLDGEGNPRYPGLVKSPETLVMYLMELGVSSNLLLEYIYGVENKYLEYKYLVQEYGKMV